ncbi:MAG TPA: hypothetical protein VK762_27810 [Polyangiaceae bacterium]|nr:hypothetical protein [Polyangiaceae bacterium]
MKLIRNALAIGAVAAASVVACSSQHGAGTVGSGSTGGPSIAAIPGQDGSLGSIHAALIISGGNLYSLNYTCTGPSVIPPGTVDFNDAQSVEWVLGGIQAGSGYVCTLSGTDSNGDPCSGTSSSFNILPGTVSGATVNVTCTVPTDASTLADVNQGSVGFDAGVTVVHQGAFGCPGINSFAISPSEVIGSQTAQLSLSEVGPTGLAADGGPSSSDIIWTATCGTPPCGTFSPSANAASPTFTCGPDQNDQIVTVTAQVTNFETSISTGVTSDVCAGAKFTTMTATIDCEGGGTFTCVGTPSTPNACVSDAGNKCVNFSTDPNNCGSCGNICPAATPNCSAGSCVAVVVAPGGPCTQLVGGVPADNAGNTKCVQCDQNTTKLCSGTEAVIVTRDQEKGLINAAGTAPTAASCYECGVNAGILDSDIQGFSGNECEDLTGSALQLCLNALNCYVGSPQSGTPGTGGTNSGATASALAGDCSSEQPAGVFNCFCGTNEPDVTDCKTGGTVAAMAGGGVGAASPNGLCISQILAGTGTTSSTINATIIGDMSNTNLGAGLAAQFLQNAGSNLTSGQACPVCFK